MMPRIPEIKIDWNEHRHNYEQAGRERLARAIRGGYGNLRRQFIGAQVGRLEHLARDAGWTVSDETIGAIEGFLPEKLVDFLEGKVVVSESGWRRIAPGTNDLEIFLANALQAIASELPLPIVREDRDAQADTVLVFRRTSVETIET